MIGLLDPADTRLILAHVPDHERLVAQFDASQGRWCLGLVRRRVLYHATGPRLIDALRALDIQMRAYPHGASWRA
jgi:hypothetical protein